jgi:hypothetical protein
VLNQVLVKFSDHDEATREVVRGMLADGTAFMTGTTFHDKAAMRISVCNGSTTEADVDASLAAASRVVGACLSRGEGLRLAAGGR